MTTRRSLLRKIGLTGIGTATGIALLPTPPHSTTLHGTVEGAEPPAAAADWIGTEITTEDETPVGRHHYAPTRDGFVPTAPFNVVLIPAADGEAVLERVMTVLDEEGWVRNPVEYTRFAWDRTTDSYVRQQATAAQTYWGPAVGATSGAGRSKTSSRCRLTRTPAPVRNTASPPTGGDERPSRRSSTPLAGGSLPGRSI
ncbi:hypothetical protein [Natronosalvus rutilus]|uniref:Uncharacterized protein n=1 Tax=Natronosalvus rutilus TaxID=2953753 RepID=A0A9E7NA44_9EURY|nr:hypothetical protein [Natronosalvus rutilus]UTF54527.1 hypothetical protein NGM29_04440 [Natronosalvus rutilus]